MEWADLKILLVRLDMTVCDLAKELGCARPSIYLAFTKGNRPGVMKRIQEFYDTRQIELTRGTPPRESSAKALVHTPVAGRPPG